MLHCLSLCAWRGCAGAAGGGIRPQNVGKCDKDTPVLRANTSIQFLTCSVRISQRARARARPHFVDARSRTITPTCKVTHRCRAAHNNSTIFGMSGAKKKKKMTL